MAENVWLYVQHEYRKLAKKIQQDPTRNVVLGTSKLNQRSKNPMARTYRKKRKKDSMGCFRMETSK